MQRNSRDWLKTKNARNARATFTHDQILLNLKRIFSTNGQFMENHKQIYTGSDWMMPRLSEDDRNWAIGMLAAGISKRDVARHFHWHASTISSLETRFQNTGTVPDRQRTGKPRATTPQQDQQLCVNHFRNRFTTAAFTARNIVGSHG